MFLRGGKRTDSFSTSSLTRLNVLFSEQKAIMTRPTMRPAFTSERAIPRRRFSQPSIMSFTVPSSSRPSIARTAMTAMNISANEITFRTCSDPSMYWASHVLAGAVNRAETHTPAMMEMMAMTCDMNPLRRPCTRAGTKQIKRMISTMFIIALKCLYLQFEKSGLDPDAKIDNYFQIIL